ncbi:hypothetical protein H4582DRAFT_2052963 [Lactarius indigo]|nr:hypothetical protein H4582DRAFT_2052963 [Lactarius indigo]
MSQPPASSSVAQNSQTTTPNDSYDFEVILEDSLEAYKKKTKQSRINPNANEGLKKWLKPTIDVLYAFSATLGEGVDLVNINEYVGDLALVLMRRAFSPAKPIFVGIGALLLAAKDLNEDQGTLVDASEQIEDFFKRLEIYIEVPPTPAMKATMVKIIGNSYLRIYVSHTGPEKFVAVDRNFRYAMQIYSDLRYRSKLPACEELLRLLSVQLETT